MSLRDQLQDIYNRHGNLTPVLVVDEARDPVSPLHSRFEWNDAVAGEAWRREQAHALIQSVRVVYRQADDKVSEKSVRAFHAVRNDTGFVYEPVEKVANDPLITKMILADMQREWTALKRRYEHFAEFLVMVRKDLSEAA